MATIRDVLLTAVRHHEAGELPQAEQLYRLILQQKPDHVHSLHGLGLIAFQAERIPEAIAYYQQALALKPDFAEVHTNLGLALTAQGKFEEAIAHYRRAIELNPGYVEAHSNLGHALRNQGNVTEAIATYDQAIAVNPNFVSAYWNRALALLVSGDLERGFREYEWRWQRRGEQMAQFIQPMWDGSDLAGQTILLHAEQGCGDTIQFVRYAPLVAQRGGRVFVECQAALVRLLQAMPGVDQVIARNEPLPHFDQHIPLMSLPRLFGTRQETVPNQVPYLNVPLTEPLPLPIPPGTKLKVGMVWSGNPANPNNSNRSCPAHYFRQLLDLPGVTFYSLQKEAQASELAELEIGTRVIDLSGQLNDFADTAAAIAQLDLVITVDTAVAHLAGALGKPVWVVLCFAADWRWMIERDDSPWYPTLQLFRQTEFADWQGVFTRVRAALQAWLQGLSASLEGSLKEWMTQAIAHHEADRFSEAAALYRKILDQQPTNADVLHALGVLLFNTGRPKEAIAYYQQALKFRPNFAQAHSNLGVAISQQGGFVPAIAHYRYALALNPKAAEVHHNLATTFKEQHQFEAAIAQYQQALALNPRIATTHVNMGACLEELGQFQAAVECYERAIAIDPNHIEGHVGRSLALLLLGDLQQGFVEYEWRWRLPDTPPQTYPQPEWDGSPLAGKTILLHGEQGFGDVLQFVRYVNRVAEYGGRIVVACQPQLVRLLATMPQVEQLVGEGEPLPPFQVHAPMLSLPRILGTTLETIPTEVPYLTVPPTATVKLTAPADTRLKVGIVWSGNLKHPHNYKRAYELSELLPVLELPHIAFYSLQKGPKAEDLKQLPDTIQVQDLGEQLNDFADTAAAIAQLDLVITMDTSVAHLAGALGKSVWLLVCFAPDWRWLLDREDSPWYPTMRLFRQQQPGGDWTAVIHKVRMELERLTDQQADGEISDVASAIATALQHHQANRITEAEAIYRQILAQNPQQIDALHLMGVIAHQRKQFAESSRYLEQTIALEPHFAEAHANLGSTLREQGRFLEAIAHYQYAIALKPDFLDAHTGLGFTYRQQGKLDDAIACYNRAVKLDPNYVEAHWNRAITWMLAGNLEQGFAEYEWRWQRKHRQPRPFSQPIWDGSDLTGKTILLYTEQGFGDAIQFIRYASLVAERGGNVIVECQAPLMRLLATVQGVQQWVERDKPLPAFDVHASLMSLPHRFGTTLTTIPNQVPYLSPPASSTLKLEASPQSRLKVGFAWSGSLTNQNNHQRACPLNAFRPLLEVPNVTFYSLQKGDRVTDLGQLQDPSLQVQDLDPHLQDFADTAAAIAQLDLVITVDTAVAHLAGALGKPVWVLLCFAPDWRWMLEREDSPWYPTMRLFRQSQPGDWTGVIDRVTKALQNQLNTPIEQTAPSPESTGMNVPSIELDKPQAEPAPSPTVVPPASNPVKPLGIGWQVSVMTGWGVYGMNLTLQLLRHPRISPMLLVPVSSNAGQLLNPLHQTLLQPAIAQQQQIQTLLSQHADKRLSFDMPILHALGRDFASKLLPQVSGKKNIGVIFFEDTDLPTEAIARAQTYDAIVAGSTWNAQVLESRGLKNVRTAPQGIDPTLFHSAPKSNLFRDRFVIFSGGKLEFRKGQDIVVAAFKRFQARHPETLLLTAWHNFWPQFMVGLEQTGNVRGLPQVGQEGRLRIVDWLVANGIPASACLDVGPIPNQMVGQIVREADVAVFTNRAEGGTNLVAMECLACGVPTILSANTGHLDLIGSDRCYALETQRSVRTTPMFQGVEGWGESDVEEVVVALEAVYQNQSQAQRRGQAAAQFMQDWTWEKQTQRLLNALQDLL